MTVLFSPVFNDAQLGTTGLPANGYLLFTYLAGSSTKQATYTTELGNVAHSNPIILNSRGEPTSGPIWLTAGVAYDFVFTSPTDSDPPVAPIRTVEDVSGVNDPEEIADEWIASGLTPTYIGATQFSVPGDQTSTLSVGRRVKITDSGGTKYATIKVSAYTSLTTLTLSGDALASPLTSLAYGILGATNTSAPLLADSFALRSGSSDKTKLVALEVDNLTTDTTRTLTVQDENGTLALTGNLNAHSNLSLAASVATNALTIALKTQAGTDPSTGNPIAIKFTTSTGDIETLSITSATSLVVPNGATLGTTNSTPFAVWVVGFNDGGTFRLGVIQCVTAANTVTGGGAEKLVTDVYQLSQFGFQISSTTIGTGSDSAGTFYSGTGVTGKPCSILGRVLFDGQATAGVWATSPIATTTWFPGMQVAGQVVSVKRSVVGTVATGSTVTVLDDSAPTNAEGDLYMTFPTAPQMGSAYVQKLSFNAFFATSAAATIAGWITDATNGSICTAAVRQPNTGVLTQIAGSVMVVGGVSITAYTFRAGPTAAATLTFNGAAAAQLFGGSSNSWVESELISM